VISVFQDFDKYLSSSFSADYWSDEGIGIAEEKLSEYAAEDWEQLMLAIQNRNTSWLVRCAEVLGDHRDALAIDILIKLSSNEDIDVQIAALDSINSLLTFMSVDESTIKKLNAIAGTMNSSSIVVKTMLDSLKSKVS
jgi:hypothetical protein